MRGQAGQRMHKEARLSRLARGSALLLGILTAALAADPVVVQAVSGSAASPSAERRQDGGTIVVEPPLPARAAHRHGRLGRQPAYPLDQSFLLHSRPGAARVIVLDFDGVRLGQTLWNSYFSLPNGYEVGPYDTDGDPLSFSEEERTAVQEVWQRVSEDYAPFDIDVTTQDPGEAAVRRSSEGDRTFGTRVSITSDAGVKCACGGLASMGSFDAYAEGNPRAHDRSQPVWVFPANLTTAKDIAEAATHEVGHTLGLSHDGTTRNVENADYYRGQGPWAPIMGVGYYRPLTTWSDGDYAAATNTEDDISVMLSSGVSLVPDDHGDRRDLSTVMHGGSEQTALGVISTRTDVDWFEFRVGSGAARVEIDPAAVGANLDIRLRIAAPDGSVLRTITPAATLLGEGTATGLNAGVDLGLESGTYALAVDGVGQGDPSAQGYSDYGSLGRYSVSVAAAGLIVATSTLPPATIGRPYAVTLSAAGMSAGGAGVAGLTWSVVQGELPRGLSFRADGRIRGQVREVAAGDITVAVTDGVSTARAELSLTAVAPLRARDLAVQRAYVGRPWTRQLPISGGLAPLSFEVGEGGLPPGVALGDGGALSGTPRRAGAGAATVMITDARGRQVTSTLSWQVHRPVTIMISRLPAGRVGRVYDAGLLAGGGATAVTWRIVSGGLPPGLRLGRGGWIRGAPVSAGTWRIHVRASDGTVSDRRTLTLRVRTR